MVSPLNPFPHKSRRALAGPARSAKVGLPPGTLVHIGRQSDRPGRLGVMQYNAETLTEQDDVTVDTLTAGAGVINWVNMEGVHDVALLQALGNVYGLHPLVLEDIANTASRPKAEAFADSLFVTLKMIREVEGLLLIEQVSVVLAQNTVLTFQEAEGDVLDGLRQRIRVGQGRARKAGADYLTYAILDGIVDHYFPVLERMADTLEDLEEEVFLRPNPGTVQALNTARRELLVLRKAIWPVRELITTLMRSESALLSESTEPFWRDVYDHALQVVDLLDSLRDMVTSLYDAYLSALSHRMNEVMQVLTIIGTIFIPLTFIAGIYGMNFAHMPELAWPWAYPATLLLMLGIAIGILWAFKRKGWL